MSCGKQVGHVPQDGDVFRTRYSESEYILFRDYAEDTDENLDTWTVYWNNGRTNYKNSEVQKYFNEDKWVYVRNILDELETYKGC